MELKSYQQNVIDDLQDYLDCLTAPTSQSLQGVFAQYWQDKGIADAAYRDRLDGVPSVCLKVPTAGGKTFIAVNALKPIFDAAEKYGGEQARFVVWLVPSEAILEQTLRNLKDVQHPYRQKLNTHFNGRVHIYGKEDVLNGRNFDADTVRQGIAVLVIGYDSLKLGKRASKEVLRAFRENPNLDSFGVSDDALSEYSESALINVLRGLQPVVVVDESHHTSSDLSEEMLKSLNPRFVLELTATPKEYSNIISHVGALSLKKEQMVKLPVIVSEQRSQRDVMMAVLTLRSKLEQAALVEQQNGGAYIRPIVLFQAEPRNRDDTNTFERIKRSLLNAGIPEEQIAIKTANINELKDKDLMSPECPVRFIITVNALKEGWDCPFAYILAAMADRQSETDVTQILGRILRQPYARNHRLSELNTSYVFTASAVFQDTLNNIVAGLNQAGFSNRDYRVAEQKQAAPEAAECEVAPQEAFDLTPAAGGESMMPSENRPSENASAEQDFIQAGSFSVQADNAVTTAVRAVQEQAAAEGRAFTEQAQSATDIEAMPPEVTEKMNIYPMNPQCAAEVAELRIPQFVIRNELDDGLFAAAEDDVILLARENLLNSFKLSTADSAVSFENIGSHVYQSDFAEEGDVHFTPLKGTQKQHYLELFNNASDETQKHTLTQKLFELAGKKTFYPITDQEVKAYFHRIVDGMSAEQRQYCFEHLTQAYHVVKTKIDGLAKNHAEQAFKDGLMDGSIMLAKQYAFPAQIVCNSPSAPLSGSLYKQEDGMNAFESQVLRSILVHDEIRLKWWHRNQEKKGFALNGFINHYPDFILMTEKNTLILLETKGDHLDGTDTQDKIFLGDKWYNECKSFSGGIKYCYMMVFEKKEVEGAYTLSSMLEILKKL